ncbi:uncharacterized protein MELLADRAFT_73632 [Melampsora larici-populina 98AG31]|uniref:Secreted protein n=1 Tax=Melampsora larici-populina (strain 98AG31 / pathotype 3-4-7) TaxID=747676 RepID=F4SAT5_MELLP|nr:uncharacterized protein MELLADRAFT_73632 [Melampsora larici-populina 98AG31]EGF98249.1 hypothetical protein MELLADRAFT_73632 [Melampsora larici-populina 98AG31]
MRSYVLCFSFGVLSILGLHQIDARTHSGLKARTDSYASSSPSAPTCDTKHPKSQIFNFMKTCTDKLSTQACSVRELCETVTSENAQDVSVQLSGELNTTLNLLQSQLNNIQKCGMDPSPQTVDSGVGITDLAWSAFQIVLNLKSIYQVVLKLGGQFKVINDSCECILIKISAILANLIGACSEQLNLFETGFFALVTPELKTFTDIGANFISFSGTFI